MVEKATEYRTSLLELMRTASANFDDCLIPSSGENVTVISAGIPISTWGEKARFLSGIPTTYVSGVLSSSDILEQQNMQLRNENLVLRDEILRIEERLTNIESSLPTEKVIVLRDVSKEGAEKEIKALFTEGQTLYYSDIAECLNIDLQLVVEVCNELQSKEEIEVVDYTLRNR